MYESASDLGQLTEAVNALLADVRTLVQVLQQPLGQTSPGPVAERVAALGSAAIPYLLEILGDDRSSESTRFFAAWAAVQAGDRGKGAQALQSEVDKDSEFSVSAAAALGRQHIHEAKLEISRALDRASARGDETVVYFSTALRDVGGVISKGAFEKIKASSPSWHRRAVEQDFPSLLQDPDSVG